MQIIWSTTINMTWHLCMNVPKSWNRPFNFSTIHISYFHIFDVPFLCVLILSKALTWQIESERNFYCLSNDSYSGTSYCYERTSDRSINDTFASKCFQYCINWWIIFSGFPKANGLWKIEKIPSKVTEIDWFFGLNLYRTTKSHRSNSDITTSIR